MRLVFSTACFLYFACTSLSWGAGLSVEECHKILSDTGTSCAFRTHGQLHDDFEHSKPLMQLRAQFKALRSFTTPDRRKVEWVQVVSEENAPAFLQGLSEFKENLKNYIREMADVLATERLRAYQEGQRRDNWNRALFEQVSEFESSAKDFFMLTGLVQDSSGVFSRVKNIFRKNKDYEQIVGIPSEYLIENKGITLTPFDFTSGFAKMRFDIEEGGVAAFVSPLTGAIEVRFSKPGQVIVENTVADKTFVPHSPAFSKVFDNSRASALNENTGAWEVHTGAEPTFWQSIRSSVAAAFNPVSGNVESVKVSGHKGVGLAYNPLTKKMETQDADGAGVVGYFDPTQGKVVWETKKDGNLVIVWRDLLGKIRVTSSLYYIGSQINFNTNYPIAGMF